ncbi:MAG TPA: exo-alpha-sialidase [Candidatus Latescibacteria bacterium]|nr:exo-alpha-sialidase [Candidatus Latescibacterota bacterium]
MTEPPDPPNQGIMFVNHAEAGRSGHLGHALVEYLPGKILAFYANCSDYQEGHNGDGWMDYRRSEDGGRTWGEPSTLEYSKEMYEKGVGHSVMCEKAVRADDGAIILFNLECRGRGWQPLVVPTYLRSADGGITWEPARPMGDQPARIWDAIVHQGCILVLELCNDSAVKWYGTLAEHHYGLYVSQDNGGTFSRRSVLPVDLGRGYGTMAILPDGSLIVYVYNTDDEKNLDYVISQDGGLTWSVVQTAFMAKQIRNPQMVAFKDGFVLHGRSGNKGEGENQFVLYTSRDGVRWDAGRYLCMAEAGRGAYSNNLLVSGPDAAAPKRLLIQASHAYEAHMTNVLHWWLR